MNIPHITLSREIVTILLLKLLVIFIIKWAWFSAPVDVKQGNTAIEQRWFESQKATEADNDR
ncbi:cytochrome oxidase putative small subunit CydP [Oceanimonas baumannii]|uniref:Uncharacterized protein n=1 Tax=Oceanimonas baumannii TaxID=129578 RepID=A0A235CIP0_9GAMM|nr:cytochrome oxidase putative small subunit CydP [Oceanimonas baumannii]MCC4263449.1 hypothetical protein [Oceanimonas baumannii]OYD24326.1 hypothetical protein B6S09_09675 [Oceanimonas baumannii]TDW59058.1 hypothetical protein LY04_01885 [Oceanimonas baumannii]